MDIGDTWNESEVSEDTLTGRSVRRLSTTGRINQTPTYHTNSGFTADGRHLAFVSVREGTTWVICAEVETGELTVLWRAPGIGDRNYIHRGMALDFPDVDGKGISGNRLCMAPRTEKAVFTCERSLYTVDIHTFKVKVILEDCGREWIFGAPCISPDEKWIVITLSSAHPELLAGKKITNHYRSFPDHRLRLIRAPLDGNGQVEVLYEHQPAQSAHCAFCPTDNNLLYFDLDLPPKYWHGGDGATPRVWLLDIPKRKIRALKTKFPGPFQTHTAWLWDGSAMAYHGSLPGGGIYIGVTTTDGQTIWEREFPDATAYGHLTAYPAGKALILDGDLSTDRLQWLYYDESPDAPPKVKPICLHSTDWGSLPGQYSHPHPLTDASGRWISFTAASEGRSDIHIVEV
jgi:Tol biopolymer transport system component